MFRLPVCCGGFLSGLPGWFTYIHMLCLRSCVLYFPVNFLFKKKKKNPLCLFFSWILYAHIQSLSTSSLLPAYHFNSPFLLNVLKRISKKNCSFMPKTKIKIHQLSLEIILRKRLQFCRASLFIFGRSYFVTALAMALMNLQIC